MDDGGILSLMTTQVRLDAELRSVVERARRQALERGELLVEQRGLPSLGLSPAASTALATWVASGDYDRAVDEITAEDPDLATQ